MSAQSGDSPGGNRPYGRNDTDDRPVPVEVRDNPSSRAMVVQPNGNLVLPEGGGTGDVHLVGMATGAQLDSFRELRTRLLAMATALGLQQFTTLVVPVTPSTGASFIARNLAAAFTLQEQRRAVLLDCNLRHPTQHLAFDLRVESDGLFDYLEHPHARAERLLRRTGLPGLYLIPAGRTPSTFREYFSSYAMRSLVAWLRKAPCYLVLDGPPIKGSPDARILSELADFVVLVAGYGRDTMSGIEQAAALFDPAKFAGVVFNERG